MKERRQKVIGEFVCDKVDNISCSMGVPFIFDDGILRDDVCQKSCLSATEIGEYANNKLICAWHITDLKIYDKPKSLGEFLTSSGTGGSWDNHYLSRPPQSYCYVEELPLLDKPSVDKGEEDE